LENYFSKVPTIVLSMVQLPTLSAKVRKEKRNLIWSIGKRIIGLSWQTTDLFQQHVNGITTLLLCKDCLRQRLLKEWTEHFRLSHFLKYNLVVPSAGLQECPLDHDLL
jgi:hypothetical protein